MGKPGTDESVAPVPTWNDALRDVQAELDQAKAHRREVVRAANDAGLSMRAIGEVIGISAAGVHRMIRGTDKPIPLTDLLQAPAYIARECDGSGGFGPPPDSGRLGWVVCSGCARCRR
jgi:hypothetical protein